MKTVSKSLVAFWIAFEIFACQLVCLLGSGIDEANRILLCSGSVFAVYLLVALRSARKWRETFVVSSFLGVILSTWVIGSFALRSAGGNGLFFRDFFCGDVFYTMDVLFHSAIIESIKHYWVPSSLVGAINPMHYHLGVHWVMALIAKVFGVSGMAMIGYLFPMIFVPMVAAVILKVVQSLKAYLGFGQELGLVDAAVLLVLICGFMPRYLMYKNGPFFNLFCRVESFALGSIFLLLSLALLPRFDRALAGEDDRKGRYLTLVILFPLLIVCTTYSKISSGVTMMAMIGGAMLCRAPWGNFRRMIGFFLLGALYVLVFLVMYCVTKGGGPSGALSDDYYMNVITFVYLAVHNPISFVLAILPMTTLLFGVGSSKWNRLRIAILFAIFISFIPFVLLKLHGGSENWFGDNCYLLAVVYLLASGIPDRLLRCVSARWGLKARKFLVGFLVFVALLPLVDPRVIRGYCEPLRYKRPDDGMLQSVRYRDLLAAKRFLDRTGREHVIGFVQNGYWTTQSPDRQKAKSLPKAYIFAIPAYLGIPTIGVLRSDEQDVYVRVSGEWTPLDKPISYGLDKYLRVPVPEYTLESALEYAAQQGRRYLLTFGAGDRVDVYDVQKKSPISFREGIL